MTTTCQELLNCGLPRLRDMSCEAASATVMYLHVQVPHRKVCRDLNSSYALSLQVQVMHFQFVRLWERSPASRELRPAVEQEMYSLWYCWLCAPAARAVIVMAVSFEMPTISDTKYDTLCRGPFGRSFIDGNVYHFRRGLCSHKDVVQRWLPGGCCRDQPFQ